MNSYKTLFKTPMVQAILRGEKDTTRRLSDVWAKRKPGDLLWVAETWGFSEYLRAWKSLPPLLYRADYPEGVASLIKWKPSIFMPRQYSRIDLEIAELFQEPLQAMNEAEARREGLPNLEKFKILWDKLSPKHPWAANPLVWVVRFKRIAL